MLQLTPNIQQLETIYHFLILIIFLTGDLTIAKQIKEEMYLK